MATLTEAEAEAQLPTRPGATPDELAIVAALRNGDEGAFASLIEHYHSAMVRLASMYVASGAVAEEVAQEAWLGVLEGIGRFEGRSSIKTWIFTILVNRARTRARREDRSQPFAALEQSLHETDEPAVEPSRFLDTPGRWQGYWVSYPTAWSTLPEERLLAQETRRLVAQAIASLPPAQQEVITLRDIEGWTAEEVCVLLTISEANQRVLLHRARAKVRRVLEPYLSEV
ncbi:MAG: sigma-70 family RNA polymerase sigma factor [Chloroflexaceae bacterium]|jgi:RNA polymerase sigma-70 factor (ECF subfamily)|nr:sigma-70 family RNA polymerase sigma factor [Chloroflexaceae bacterium]